MTAIRYVRRPHRARHQTWEYVGADHLSIWLHLAYFGLIVLVLIVAVLLAGGTLAVEVH